MYASASTAAMPYTNVLGLIANFVRLLKLLATPRLLHMTTPERNHMCSCCLCHLVSLQIRQQQNFPCPLVFVLLLQRMYVGLSDEEARRGMLEMKLGDCAQGLQQADLAHMAACTHDFSGSDIAVLAGHLLMLPVRLTQQAICFRYSIPNQTACCNVCDAYVDLAILRMTTTVPSYYTCCLHASHEQSLAGFASCAAKGCILRACDNNLRLQ